MKQLFFLVYFLMFIPIELNAQQDTVVMKDSVPSVTVTMPDSINFDRLQVVTCGPWFCNPEEFKLSDILVSSIKLESPYTPEGARRDIKSGKPVILFPGGIITREYNSKEDKEFQERYHVAFLSQGCIRLPGDDREGYNKVIFAYLDKKYGTGWRNELHHNAIGFVPPKTSNVVNKISLDSPLAMQLANPNGIDSHALNPETETSVWWYVLPTSGFALLLSLYFIIKRKRKD